MKYSIQLPQCIYVSFILDRRTNREADWTNELRNHSMYSSVELKRWYIVVPERARREAADFINVLMDAAKGLRFEISRPRELA